MGCLHPLAVHVSCVERSFSGIQDSPEQPFIRPGLGIGVPSAAALMRQPVVALVGTP
jgi:hypothetical protein